MTTDTHIVWREIFSTGIASVDYEHQELIKQINHVATQMSLPADPEHIIESLGDVFAQVSAHFALEESIMRRMKYEDYHDHKEDHEILLDEIRDIMDAYEAKQYDEDIGKFINMLNNWFLNHFSTKDAKLHGLLDSKDD